MADCDQRSPKGELTQIRDLIAKVKSQRSVFEHNFDLLQRQRDLKDVCDWAESITTNNRNSHESHARQLILEKQKIVQQHAKKNAVDKLEEIQELKRQKAMNFKDSKKSKYFNVNPRLLRQKRSASDCERCTKKSSQEKLMPGKSKDRLPSSSSAATCRPKSAMTTGIMSHKVSNITIGQQKIIRPAPRATTFAERQLAQSLKEKLRISLRQTPKITLLSVTQKSNAQTSTKATNTAAGWNAEDGRVGVEILVHQDEVDVVANKELKTPRALSIRQLPGISVPAVETLSRNVGPGHHLHESIPLDSDSGQGLTTNFGQPCSTPNVEYLDVWSAAEVGVPEFDDDDYVSASFKTQPNFAHPTFHVDSYEDDDWLGATRQWLEQQIVEFVLSELQHHHDEIDECGDHLMQEPDGDVGLPGVTSMMTPPTNESLLQSSSSETSSDAEELVYTDTFEDSEIVENSEPNAPRISSIISEAPAPQGPAADGGGGVTRTLTSPLSSASADNHDDLSCQVVDSLKHSTKESSSLGLEKSKITDIADTRPTSSDHEQQDSTSHSVDPTESDQNIQEFKSPLSQLAAENSFPDSSSLKFSYVGAVQSGIDPGTPQHLVKKNPSDNLKVSAVAVSSTPSASSVFLANINLLELAESSKIDRDDPSEHQVDFKTNQEVDLTQRLNADAVPRDITASGPKTLLLPKIDSIQVTLHDEALDDHDVPVSLDDLTQDNCHEKKNESEILKSRPETETKQELEQKQETEQNSGGPEGNRQETEQNSGGPEGNRQETEQNSGGPEGNRQETNIDTDWPSRRPNYHSSKSTTLCNKESQTLQVDHDSQGYLEENLESQRKVIENIDKSSMMDNTASDSATLSTLPNDEDDDVDTNFSIGQIISANKLRHVAYNRMKRKKLMKTSPEVTNEPSSTASTLDDTDDLATDSDVWGVSASTSVWSEGEIKLDPKLGAVLSRTSLTMPTRFSPGEIPVDPRTFRRHRRPTPQRVSFETTSEIEDVSDVTSAMDALMSENRSLGEL